MAVPTEALTLKTSDGVALEAELRAPAGAWGAAVLLHPHPQLGGDMRASIPAYLFDTLPGSGVATLRFNFRGTGESGGQHDEGRGERLDAVAALDALHPVVEGLPLLLAGWSFGGDVCLAVGDPRVSAWLAVAAPLRVVPIDEMAAAHDPRPTVLAVPQYDQYAPPDKVRAFADAWEATRIEVVPGADHFLAGRLDRVAAIAFELLESLAAA